MGGESALVTTESALTQEEREAKEADALEDARLAERSIKYPKMVYGKNAAEPNIHTDSLSEPSIPMADGVVPRKVDWLTTNLAAFAIDKVLASADVRSPSDDVEEGIDDPADAEDPVAVAEHKTDDANGTVRTEQLDPELWAMVERLVG